MCDILLVNSRSPLSISGLVQEYIKIQPLGLQYLSACLQKERYEVMGVDLFNVSERIERFRSVVQTKNFKVIGISSMTESSNNALRIARLCKQVSPRSIIVMGGPHVTFMTTETLRNAEVDFVIRGEGERSFLRLVDYIIRDIGSLSELDGVSYRNGAEIVHNRDVSPIEDLDALPFPDRQLFTGFGERSYIGNISTTRGCAGKCVFCAASALSGSNYRMRSAGSIVEEIVQLRSDNQVRHIFFVDDTFTVSRKRLTEFCEMMINKRIRMPWSAEARVDTVTEEILELMKRSGCNGLQFGVESGSQGIVDKTRKGIRLERIHKLALKANKLGIKLMCSFIIGHPDDTVDTIEDTVRFAEDLQKRFKANCLISMMTPFPGTYLHDHLEEFGIQIVDDDFDNYHFNNPVIETKNLTTDQIRALHFDAIVRLSKSRDLVMSEQKGILRRLADRASV